MKDYTLCLQRECPALENSAQQPGAGHTFCVQSQSFKNKWGNIIDSLEALPRERKKEEQSDSQSEMYDSFECFFSALDKTDSTELHTMIMKSVLEMIVYDGQISIPFVKLIAWKASFYNRTWVWAETIVKKQVEAESSSGEAELGDSQLKSFAQKINKVSAEI